MPGHTEILVKPPVKQEDPRDPENCAPPVPLQTQTAGGQKPPQTPPVVAAPPVDPYDLPERVSPLDGRRVFDNPAVNNDPLDGI